MIRLTRAGSPWLFGALLSIQTACAGNTWDQAPRPVRDAPEEFAVDPERAPHPASRGCAVHLIDSLTGSTLKLVRSTALHPGAAGVLTTAIGDYEVKPPGRYGLKEKELLRVECPSGRPVGAVH